MTLENTAHYTLNASDSDAEYRSIYPGHHLGFVFLGPKQRFFGISMFHQIHCLDALRQAVLGRHENATIEEAHEHTTHCLNYLRQSILCSADTTLEPEVPPEGSLSVGLGLGVTHVCRDWSKVYSFVEENDKLWNTRPRPGSGT